MKTKVITNDLLIHLPEPPQTANEDLRRWHTETKRELEKFARDIETKLRQRNGTGTGEIVFQGANFRINSDGTETWLQVKDKNTLLYHTVFFRQADNKAAWTWGPGEE